MSLTLQSNIRNTRNKDYTQFSFFVGGLNVKNKALANYSPLKTGYARLFITKVPKFMELMYGDLTKNFRHMLEYCFVGVDGIQNLTMDFEQVTGGYVGQGFDVATTSKDDTNEITVKLYEFNGSPVREYLDLWITGIADRNTGLAHYHGAFDKYADLEYNQANHTMEAIYVNTDATGRAGSIEYACMITNMMPKDSKRDHFNFESGQHQIVQMDVTFTAVKYESIQINAIAAKLLEKYAILRNYLNFDSDYRLTGSGSGIQAAANNGIQLSQPNITDWTNPPVHSADGK